MLGKLPVPGRLTYLDIRARATALAIGAGGGYLDIFSRLYFLSSPSLWETLNQKTTNQTTPTAHTASAVGPCPTLIQISRAPRHWMFTQQQRTTRPPPVLEDHPNLGKVYERRTLSSPFVVCNICSSVSEDIPIYCKMIVTVCQSPACL